MEFALIVALILAILFGIMEFARAWQYNNALTNGVRAGARYASTLANTTSFSTVVKRYTFGQITSAIPRNNMTLADIGVFKNETEDPDTGFVPGDTVTVEARYDFEILTGSIIPFFRGTRQLERQATMRHE